MTSGSGANSASEGAGTDGADATVLDDLRVQALENADLPGETELLRLAVQQAAAALGGLGGMAHLAGEDADLLRLVAVSGIPAEVAHCWERAKGEGDSAPARAMTERRVAWSTAWPDADAAEAHVQALHGWQLSGTLSAPIMAHGFPVGALSVLTRGRPALTRERVLADLARVLGERLPKVRRSPTGATPWWQEPLRARQQRTLGRWTWDVNTGSITLDEIGRDVIRLAGLNPDTWDARVEAWMARIHPDDRPGAEQAIEQSLAYGQPFVVEYRVLGDAGEVNWVELRGILERDEVGGETRMTGTIRNITAQRSQFEWLVGLLELHPDPIQVLSADGGVQWANRAARKGNEIVGAALRETSQGVPELLNRARAAPGSPVTMEIKSWEQARGDSGGTAWYLARAVEVGAFVAVQMVDITHQKETELARAERRAQMQKLNTALIRALDVSDVVKAVTEHVLPLVDAEGLIVHDLTGPSHRLVGETGYSPEFLEQLEALGGHEELEAVVHSVAPEFVRSLDEFARRWPGLLPLARLGGKSAWAVLPLIVGDRRVGTCLISWSRPRTFTDDDISLLGTVGVTIAQALGNARLYEEARHRAERLQQELMPGELPILVGVESATRYRPASGKEVGGDWYDAIPLPGGRTLAVIGDVMGHGLEQAITMGILRHAALTLAMLDLPVDEIMAQLNDVTGRLSPRALEPATYATCLLALYDPASGACAFLSAGHPPPIVLRPGKPPQFPDVEPSPPLGLAQVTAPVTELVLEPGSVLLLYTDGLLDRADLDPTALAQAITRHTEQGPMPSSGPWLSRWLEDLCDAVFTGLSDRGHDDDAALLALGVSRVAADCIAVRELPWAAKSAAQARGITTEQLSAWGVPDLTDRAVLIVSELMGNTVRHAVGLGDGTPGDNSGFVRLRLLNLDTEIVCEVHDGSEATPRVRHPMLEDEFGRGLQLVSMMADRWGTRYTETGKCIWAALSTL